MTLKAIARMIVYYNAQVLSGWQVKIPLATLGSIYSTYIGGDVGIVILFLVAIFLDLVFGSWLAIKNKCFDPHQFGLWILKVCSYLAIVLLLGATLRSMVGNLTVELRFMEWIFGGLILTELLSIIRKMHLLGIPVPKSIVALITMAQRRAMVTAEKIVGGSDDKNNPCGGKP